MHMYFVIISSWKDIAFVWNNFPLLKDALTNGSGEEEDSFTDGRSEKLTCNSFQLMWSKDKKQKSTAK